MIEGVAMKGPISSAKVEAFAVLDDGTVSISPFAQTTTDEAGRYALDLQDYRGPILLRVTGTAVSRMRDEATGGLLELPAGFSLRALAVIDPVPASGAGSTSKVQNVAITPLSDLAASLALELGGGRIQRDAIAAATATVRDSVGFDPVATLPVAAGTEEATSASVHSRMYGVSLAAVSSMAAKGNLQDPDAQRCLDAVHTDPSARIACAAQLVARMIRADPGTASTQPQRAALDFVAAVRSAESDPAINRSGVILSEAPAILRLSAQAANPSTVSSVPFSSSPNLISGMGAARKFLDGLRANADAIEFGLDANGLTTNLSSLGRSAEAAGTMALDLGVIVELLDTGVKHWTEFKSGRRSHSVSNLPSSWYGPRPAYTGCTVYEGQLTGNFLLEPYGIGLKGSPHISLPPTSADLKDASYERRSDPSLIVLPSLFAPATAAARGSWFGCSRYSSPLSSLVAPFNAPSSTGLSELNSTTQYRQIVRFRVDAQDSQFRPTRLSYSAMTRKEYWQRYSANDPMFFWRQVNLLASPVYGVIDLAWSGEKLVEARVVGDLPPSVDDTTVQQWSVWPYTPISRDVLRAEKYSANVSLSGAFSSDTARLDVLSLQLGSVPLGSSMPNVSVEMDSTAGPSFIVVPRNDGCAELPKGRISLAVRVSAPSGQLRGLLNLTEPPTCGAGSSEAKNVAIQLNGSVWVNDNGNRPIELTDVMLRASALNGVPTLRIEGTLRLPLRPPLSLAFSGTQTEATSSTPGVTNVFADYVQDGFSISFSGIEQTNRFGQRISSSFVMSGTGGVSAAWSPSDRIVTIRENGRSIGEINARTGRVLFNDGTFQYLR